MFRSDDPFSSHHPLATAMGILIAQTCVTGFCSLIARHFVRNIWMRV
ncbi:MAG: hypothetical protein OJF48_002516 [Afipia sp.]|nr:MAG: hypothetical protein OJF48_002516 [Afipia sp.]